MELGSFCFLTSFLFVCLYSMLLYIRGKIPILYWFMVILSMMHFQMSSVQGNFIFLLDVSFKLSVVQCHVGESMRDGSSFGLRVLVCTLSIISYNIAIKFSHLVLFSCHFVLFSLAFFFLCARLGGFNVYFLHLILVLSLYL